METRMLTRREMIVRSLTAVPIVSLIFGSIKITEECSIHIGNFTLPEFFEDVIIQTPLLQGELFSLVSVRKINKNE